MMKNVLFLFPFLLNSITFTPTFLARNSGEILNLKNTIFERHDTDSILNYYSTIQEGIKGDEALSSLQTILKNGQEKVKYESGNKSSKAWDGYYLFERNFTLSPVEESELTGEYKRSNIWINSMYLSTPIYIEDKINSGTYSYVDSSNETQTKSFVNSKAQFDREHVFVKKYGFNGENEAYKDYTAGCDIHNLHIADHYANSIGHNDLPYGTVLEKNESSAIISEINGEITGYKGENKDGITVFEPMDRDKGDVARSIFYMCARYHTYEKLSDKDETPSLTISDNIVIDSTTSPIDTKDNPAAYGLLSDLLAWNELDPVSESEKYRNDLIYNTDQGNRNPFIDFPHWANACFDKSNTTGLTFEVKETPHITLEKDENFKDTYYFFENFDPTGLKVKYFDAEGNTSYISDFKLETSSNPLTTNYTFFGFGTLDFKAKATINGVEYVSKNTLSVTYTASRVQMGILVIILIVLLIIFLIIYFSASHHHKIAKKYKKVENRIVKLRPIEEDKPKKKKNRKNK